jgi:DNA-binding transcriptional MerR regulator
MRINHQPRWTLRQLKTLLEAALQELGVKRRNNQASDDPDVRTFRFYMDIGLLDRATVLEGRTGKFGLRHLMQLVAIRRLQSDGLTLNEIQGELLNITDEKLSELARLPDVERLEAGAVTPSRTTHPTTPTRDEAFWRQEPTSSPDVLVSNPHPSPASWTVQALALRGGITLLVPCSRSLTDDDKLAIEEAAAPLLHTLHARGLVPRSTEVQA